MENKFIDANLPVNMPGTGLPQNFNMPQVQTEQKELTPEMLEEIINDKSEHPEIRAKARKLRDKLLAGETIEDSPVESETIEEEVEEKPVTSPKPKKKSIKIPPKKVIKKPQMDFSTTQDKKLSVTGTQVADSETLTALLSSLQQDLQTDEFYLLTEEGTPVQIRSMKTEEYKFLTKQLEMFEGFIREERDLTPIEVKAREAVLYNALDSVLQRCIVNPVNVLTLNQFDWLYSLLYLRCISRTKIASFTITKGEGKNKTAESVDIDLEQLLIYLKDNKERFECSPMDTIEISEGFHLYLMLPTRGDYQYINSLYEADQTNSYYTLMLAMCIRAFVTGGVANILAPEQRIEIFNQLKYDNLKKIGDAHSRCRSEFFNVINEYFEEVCGEYEALAVSDFILSFFDF